MEVIFDKKERKQKTGIKVMSFSFFILSILNINSTTLALSRCRVGLFLCLCVYLMYLLYTRQIKRSWITKWVILWFAYAVFEMINTMLYDELYMKQCVALFIEIILIFLISNEHYNAKEIKTVFYSVILTATIFSIILIFYGYAYSGFAGRRSIKIQGHEAIDPNFIAAFIVMGCMLTYVKILYQWQAKIRNLFQIVWIGCFILQTTAILLTSSRGALVAMAVGIIWGYITYLKGISVKRKIIWIMLSFLLLFIGIRFLLLVIPQSQIVRLFSFRSYAGGGGRITLWKNSLEVISNSPLFGFGYASSQAKYRLINIENSFAHNTYLIIFETYGLIGGILYLSSYGIITYKLWRMKKELLMAFWVTSCSAIFFLGGLGALIEVLPLLLMLVYTKFMDEGGRREQVFL